MSKKLQFVCPLLMLGLAFLLAWPPRGLRFGGQAAIWQSGPQSAAQAGGENSGQAPRARQAKLVSAAPAVTVTDHKMTAGPIPNQCVAPAAKYNFTPTDAQAYQWILIAGANVGDVLRWEFVQPNGSVYFQTQSTPLTASGSFCFSPSIFIAGQAAASLPGAWQVRVFYNGALLLTENFTIGPAGGPVTVTDHKMTGGPIPDNCVAPVAKSTFAPNDAFAYQWSLISGIRMGDVVRWEFIQPNGTLYQALEFVVNFSGSVGCFSASLPIAGQAAASLQGNWQVRVLFNTAQILTESFTIAANTCPTVTSLSTTSGAVGSTVTITGTNFTGVSAVRFTNNITAQFILNSATQITATVPSGATSGPITISKPNCADVQTASFNVITQPAIDVTPTSLDFGGVAVGQTKDLQLTVRNTGSATLTVSSIISNNARFSVTSPTVPFNVAAGSQQAVTIRFTPLARGAQSGTLSINSNDPNRARVDVALSGAGQAPMIEVTPASLDFGNVRVGQTRDLQLTVRNTGELQLNISSITSNNALFSVTSPTGAFNLATGASATVNLRFAPTSAGLKTGTLSINSNDPNRARVDVALSGTGLAPNIEVTPASLSFGNVVLGESKTLPVTVRNTGNATLNISSITSSDPQFTLSLLTTNLSLPAGTSVNFNVRFTPTSAGAKTGTLSINSNDPNRPRVDVPMTGTGLAPVIEVTPTSLSFGELRLAQTRDLTFSIRNTGQAPLKVNSITSSNPQFSVTQLVERPSGTLRSLPLNIAPGTSVEVTVRFRPGFVPASVGAQSGTITISSNDPNRPRVDVALSGTGLGPLLSVPSSLTFGSVTICSATATTASLTLTNTGNAPLTVAALSIDNQSFALTPRPALPLTIAPGASLTLNLSFYTRVTGTQTGRLLISSNAVNNPGFAVALGGAGTPVPPPAISQISVSRTTLSHGRADSTRPVTPLNPFGLTNVIGFVFPGGPLPANSIAPGVVPPPLIGAFPGLPPSAIAAAPDPLHITLAGGTANPIVVSAANIPSCFTLAVAEGVTAPNLTRWERVGTRFGSGNLYAAVSIPGTPIFAGMELVTDDDLNAYTANSIIYEAPDFGFVVAPAGQNGGVATLQARARRIPPDPQCQTLLSAPQSTAVEFSRTVRVEILSSGITITRNDDDLEVTVAAQISGNFDTANNTVVRFAFDGNSFDEVADEADLSSGAPRVVMHTFHVPLSEECKLAQITVVASSTGNFPFAPPPINPFLVASPDSIGLFTFRSGGCTVEDTKSVLLRASNSNCDGGGPVGWIQGTITDAATGEPIAGAFVSVAGTTIFAVTGDDGTYELNNVPAGLRNLDASADGFNSAQAQVNVLTGQVVTRDIRLSPFSGTITGVVLNAFDSQPIAGASVVVKGTNVAAVTGGDGRYTLSNVPVGSQTVAVSATNFDSTEEIVTVVADQTNVRDYFLTPKTGTIRGIVRNATTNAPIVGATVTTGSITVTTGGDGSYTLANVAAGAQTLSVTADRFNPGSASVTVPAGGAINQDFALTPQLGTVSGIVRDDFNEPIAGATVTAAGVTVTTGSDGSYTLANLPVGAQTVNGSATGYRSASATVTVLANQTVQQDLTLPRVTGGIRGKITNAVTGQPINGADVDLLPFPLSFGTSDAGGNYTMTGVPTGPQVILASAPGYYAKLAVVNVGADQTSTQDFALTPQVGTVTGVVFDSFSQPVVGATLSVAGTSITTTSNGEGIYTLSNVPVGAQTINVSVPGLRSASVTVNVVANETIYKDIYLETPTGGVRGRVTNAANNQPIAGASILVGIPFGAVYYSAFTDANGNYSLSDIPAQRLTIYVGADGFMPTNATVTIAANQTATQDFALTPEGATTGTITGVVRSTATNNPPVAGATITVAGTSLSTTSGGDGSYTLANVPAGAQTLNVSKTGFRTATVSVTVTAGQTVTQNISLSTGAGTITGTVRNAANGQALSGATVSVAGTNISTTSGGDGSYTLANVPAGAQTLNASANGFIATQVQVTVPDGQTVTQNISLSPTLPPGEIRITLNWSKDGNGHPDDLDMHLIGPNPDGSCFEIFYNNLGSLTSAPFAMLEVDNISIGGHPPTETIHIGKLSSGIYRFYVNNFSGSHGEDDPTGLSRSQATVQVIGANGSLGSFTVPGGSGFNWTVFEINGQTGAITTINQLASPASGCR